MNERDNKPQKKSIIKFALCVILCAVLAYIAFQVIMVINPSIQTRTAIKYDISDSLVCTALMAMPQEEIYFNGGVPDYLISNGDKVAAGSAIARIFSSAEQAHSFAKAQSVSEEISLLKTAQISTPGVNIESLLIQAKSSILSIIDKADNGNFLSIAGEKSKYQSAVNKTHISTGKMINFDERIALLSDAQTQLLNASGDTPLVYAPKNGYFVSSKYSQAQQYTYDELAAMSALQLKQMSETQPAPAAENVLGRLIYDYKWECYLSVSASEAKKFIEGKKIYVAFSEVSINQVPATVSAISIDEQNDTAKITIVGDYMTSDIAAIQHSRATITFPYSSTNTPYTGIRVPREALRVVNGEYGVYIRYGNLAQYKKIEILFENENYLLVPLTYKKGINELKLYDEIIVEGRGLLPKAAKDSSSTPQISSQTSSQP